MAAVKPLQGLALVLITLSLSLGTFMMALDYSIANVSVPYIAGDLGVSNTDGTWVITCFAAGNAIGLPMTGFLSDRLGAVKTFVIACVLFTFFSWTCGAALNFPMLLMSRFCQGFVAGPMIPLSQSLLMVFYPEAKRKYALAIWAAVVVVGPVLGPILGGYLTFNYVWRWIFYINIPFGIIASVLTWKLVKDRDTMPLDRKIDFIGLALLAVGVTCLQVLVDFGQQYDWFRSDLIRTLAIGSFIGFIFFALWAITGRDPLIDFKLFKNRNFALGTFVTATSFAVIFGNMVVFPLFLEETMNYTAQVAGLAVSTMGILPLVLLPLVAKMMEKVRLKFVVMICFLLFWAVYLFYSFITTQISFSYAAISRLMVGLPVAIYMAPLTAITLAHVSPNQLTAASGVFHFFRIFCGGLGTSLFVTLWERRTVFHRFNLIETLTPFNPLADSALKELHHAGLEEKAGLETLNVMAGQQAAVLAANDVFWTSAWLFLPLIFFAFWFQKRKTTDVALSTVH